VAGHGSTPGRARVTAAAPASSGARPGRGKLIGDPVLRQFVAERLEKRWSPEQISQALRGEFPDDPGRHLVHETIYQAVYRPELGGLRRDLPKVLRTGRRRRRPCRRPDARRAGSLTGMTTIDRRPAEAGTRDTPGHWEGDLITGAANRSAIGTLVERSSRFTILLHLSGGLHTAEAVRDALVQAMGQLPAQLRRSLTWDQGKELALHAEIARALDMPVFFCDPHSPWQRPANGLLRQYFPKGNDLRVHSPQRLAAVAGELNERPRKVLGWESPAACMTCSSSTPAPSPPQTTPPGAVPRPGGCWITTCTPPWPPASTLPRAAPPAAFRRPATRRPARRSFPRRGRRPPGWRPSALTCTRRPAMPPRPHSGCMPSRSPPR
jgi:IS30 family transposase